MSVYTGRRLVKVSLTTRGDGTWDVRIEYHDDDTEDRRGGFSCRALAHGWAEARLERHFRQGVPGRLGAGA
jgi:hypothetical protein